MMIETFIERCMLQPERVLILPEFALPLHTHILLKSVFFFLTLSTSIKDNGQSRAIRVVCVCVWFSHSSHFDGEEASLILLQQQQQIFG